LCGAPPPFDETSTTKEKEEAGSASDIFTEQLAAVTEGSHMDSVIALLLIPFALSR
jgi:hypothetical protein